MSKIDSEVPALISAVLEYKKFRQLACYSIECVTKVVSPQNRDYKRNLQIAFSANAPKCVVEVLRVHMDKEDCLLVCVDCLHKLAVDTDNAEAIAREGGVRAVLASIGAIPTITEDALCEAMAILDKLCNHKRALEILADNENVGAVIDLVRRKSASSKVKVNCMRALDKLTRLPKGVESFIHCNGIPELLTLVADYKIKCASTEFDEVDLETLTTATKILLRLCKHSSTVVDQLMAANGAEVYVGVLGSLTDMPAGQLQDPESGGPLDTKDCGFSRLAAKLISNMYTGRISELVKSLKNSSQLNEFTLNLMGSLAMDASSSAGIVNNGGIEILLLGCCGDSSSTKILEVSTRAMSRLAGNVSNLEGLVGQGAVEGLVTALISPQGSTASAADAVLGLTLMCSTGEYVDRVYSAGGLSAVLTCISGVANSVEGDELRQKEIIMAGLSFLEHIAGASLDGDGQQSMLLSMSKNDLWVILTIIEKYHSDVPLVTRAIRVVTAYVKANLAHSLLETDGSCVAVIPLCIALLSEHAMFNDSENVSASDSAVGLVDEVLQLLNALLLVTAEVKSNHESIRTSQARVVDQQRALHATPTWKAAANELVEQGDGVVNLAILGFLERTAILSSIDSMDTFKMYSAVSLGRCTPLVALWADGGAKGNPSPIPLLAEQTAAFAQNWSDGSFEVNGRTKALIAAHSAVVSLGLFASVCPGHPALAMLASEQVIEKLFFLLYALMNSPLTAAMCEGPESGLVGSLVSATCLSSVHIIGALHMQLCVPGDVMSEEAFLQLLGDPLSAAQLCVDVLQSSTLGTMSNSLQALRLLWILKRIATQLVSPHLVSSGGIEALSAILKATGPMAAAAANSVQADVGFRTVVTVVHIVANLFDGIASLKGSIDGARELSRRGGVKACIASFIDPLGAVGVKDSPATTSSDGEVILGASKSIDDRTLSYSTQCADAALLFLYSLEQVARLGHDECAILSKLGCVLLFFRLCDRFEGNADIFDTTNRIVQLLVAPEDMLAILDSIKTKYAPACVATTLFGSRCSSDGMEKAIREVNRLCHFMGLVPMVEAFLAHDGFATMQACIGNSIAAIATARSASGPVDLLQLRGNFLNACVRVLCRSAATGLLDDSWSDVTDATAKLVCEHLLLILKKANEDPRSVDSVTLVETLQSIARMAITMPTSASLFYSGGATGLLVKRIQLSCMDASGGGLFEAQVMELSVAALAAIAQSCAYSYDYLLSTSKLIRQICSCITEYIQETGGVGLAPWITMTIAFLSKIFAVLHACTAGDEEAVCGQGGAPPVAVLLQVLRTAGSDIFGVLLTLKGSQLSSVIKPSTSIMDTLTNILLSSLNLGVALTDEDIVVIKDAFADGDIKSATCFDICATLLTTEVTAIPKCTQLMRRVWLSSNGILMQDAKKKRELEAQMQSYLALLRAFAGVSGGRFVTANSTARGRIRKMLNQTGVGKLLISILSGSADLSDSLRDDVEATLSLLSDEEYGENAVQTFAEYITTLANNLTPEGYVECAINRIKTGAPDLGEGEEDAETILKALKNTLKLLQRYMQRGTHLNTSDILTLAAAALTVSRKLFDINNHIESSGYDDISRHHAPDLVGRQGAVLDMLGHSLQILQKLFGAFAQIDSETLATSFDFVAVLGLVNDGLVWYVASLERQYEAKTSKQSSLALAIKADFTEVLRVSGMVLSSVLELCTTFDRSRRQGVCEAVLTMGLANNLHKISSLNGSCSGIIFYPSAASPSFVSDIKAIASKVLTVLHDSLLVDAEVTDPKLILLFALHNKTNFFLPIDLSLTDSLFVLPDAGDTDCLRMENV